MKTFLKIAALSLLPVVGTAFAAKPAPKAAVCGKEDSQLIGMMTSPTALNTFAHSLSIFPKSVEQLVSLHADFIKAGKTACDSKLIASAKPGFDSIFQGQILTITYAPKKIKYMAIYSAFNNVFKEGIKKEEIEDLQKAYYNQIDDFSNMSYIETYWRSSTQTDDMRGTETQVYSLESEDAAPLAFPYKAAHARIYIFQRYDAKTKKYSAPSVSILVDDGQLSVRGYGSDYGSISFKRDSDSVQTLDMAVCDDSNKQICGGAGTIPFAIKLESSDSMIIELPFFDNGSHQFHFKTSGLHLKPFDL